MNFFLFSLLGVTQLLSLGIPLGQWHLQQWVKAQSRGIFNIHQWPGERMQEINHLSPLKTPLPPVNRNNCHTLVFFQPPLVKVWPGVCCVSVCDFVFQTVPEGAWVLPSAAILVVSSLGAQQNLRGHWSFISAPHSTRLFSVLHPLDTGALWSSFYK